VKKGAYNTREVLRDASIRESTHGGEVRRRTYPKPLAFQGDCDETRGGEINVFRARGTFVELRGELENSTSGIRRAHYSGLS
jgi:hypothetical protein